jgi:hypothetical protein
MLIFSIIILIIVVAYYYDYGQVKHGYRKTRYLTSSGLNPYKQLNGKKWTDTAILKNRHGDKNGVFIGEFRFSTKALKNVNMPFFWKNYHERTEIYLDPIKDLRMTTILYSGQGGGKSIYIINLLDQTAKYDNALVHDGGKLEMTEDYYNPMRDIILCPYDDRAHIIDILDHDPMITAQFFNLLMRSANKESNFFTKGSAEHFVNILRVTNAQEFTSRKEKWAFFINELEELIKSSLTEKQRSEGDIISTLKQPMTPFLLLNYRIQNDENLKLFTADEFLDRKHGAKLFVSYPDKFADEMKSFSAAFIHLYTQSLLSKPNHSSMRRLLIVDEMSSYIRMINDPELLKDQLEKPRSRGAQFVGALQGIDEDPKINGIIEKTCKTKLYFRTDGQATKENLIKDVGEISYEVSKESRSEGKSTFSTGTQTEKLIKQDDFFDLGDKHEFIAQIGDSLFRGYTPLPRTELEIMRLTKEGRKNGTLREDERAVRSTGFVEYSKRKAFDNYLAARYKDFQTTKRTIAKTEELAEAALSGGFEEKPTKAKSVSKPTEPQFDEKFDEPKTTKSNDDFGDEETFSEFDGDEKFY